MKCLITGGAGFVGSNLAALLLQKSADVHIFDSLARDARHAACSRWSVSHRSRSFIVSIERRSSAYLTSQLVTA